MTLAQSKAILRTSKIKEIQNVFFEMEKVKMDDSNRLAAYQLLAHTSEGMPGWIKEKNETMIRKAYTNIYTVQQNVPTYVKNYYGSHVFGWLEKNFDAFVSTFTALTNKLLEYVKNQLDKLGKFTKPVIDFIKWLPFITVAGAALVGYGTYRVLRGVYKSAPGQEFTMRMAKTMGDVPAEVIKLYATKGMSSV